MRIKNFWNDVLGNLGQKCNKEGKVVILWYLCDPHDSRKAFLPAE